MRYARGARLVPERRVDRERVQQQPFCQIMAAPFVHYYCACPDLGSAADAGHDLRRSPEATAKRDGVSLDYKSHLATKDRGFDASVAGRHLLSAKAANYLYPLSRLYFCEDCHQIRCPSCVQDEIISYYCPNCLFEVWL